MQKFILAMMLIFGLGLTACQTESGSQLGGTMTPEKLASLIQKFDEDAKVGSNNIEFTLNERDLFLVYDKKADRMRIVTPIAPSGLATDEVLIRLMQANYDAVLDSRYAMANDLIWAVFIHPLSSLTQDEFLSGVAQTFTAAETFGTSYTSGAFVFGGGDSNTLHKDLLKELEDATRKGKEI